MTHTLSRITALVAGLTGSFTTVHAVILELDPAAPAFRLGESTTVTVNLFDLFSTPGIGPRLGGYSLTLGYDASIITPTSITFGSGLALGTYGSLQDYHITEFPFFGTVDLDETSLETTATLLHLQPSAFALATITFTGVGVGSSLIDFTWAEISDQAGTAAADIQGFNTYGTSLTVVPEPAWFGVMSGCGMLGFALWRRRNGGLAQGL